MQRGEDTASVEHEGKRTHLCSYLTACICECVCMHAVCCMLLFMYVHVYTAATMTSVLFFFPGFLSELNIPEFPGIQIEYLF